MRVSAIRSMLGISLAAGAVAAAAGCGARSQLDAPTLVGGGGGGGAGGAVPCMTGMLTMTRADPTVMFVIDRSGSMQDHLGKTNGQESRWAILTNALSTTLPPVDQTMGIGALLYPAATLHGGGLSCTVPIVPDLMPATGHVAALIDVMQSSTPGGGTPTADAIDLAAVSLTSVHAATTARALVLATDGGPNCNDDLDASTCTCVVAAKGCNQSRMCLDDTRTVSRIAHYHDQGLPTYVIGIQDPGDTQFTDVLNAMADAGGRPNVGGAQDYYVASSGAELSAALTAIRDQVGLCTYLLTSVPDSGGSMTVRLGDAVIPFDPTGMNGWMWGNKDNGEVVLVGAACETATAMASVTLVADVQCAGSDGGAASP